MLLPSRSLTSLITLFLLTVLLVSACAPANPTLVIGSVPALVGETFKVPVLVQNVADLTAIEIHLAFDHTKLEVIEVTNGGFVQADFPIQNTFDNTAGTLDYAIAQLNRPPATGSGTLLEIVFRAKTSGEAAIQYRATPAASAGALLSNSDGQAIAVTLTNGSAKIK